MDLFSTLAAQFNIYLLILVRVSGILVATPFFGSRNVPAMMKIGLAMMTSFFMLPLVRIDQNILDYGLSQMAVVVASEMAMGFAMGLILTLIFMVFQMAGQVMEVPMGFRMVNVLDPMLGQQMPILGQFQFVLAFVAFLLIHGHHLILTALANSFQLVPLGGWRMWPGLAEVLNRAFSLAFSLGFRIAFPIVAAMLITDVALGLIARTVPQMNVFILGFPIKIAIGLILVMLLLPAYLGFIENLFSPSSELFQYLRAVMGGISRGL